MSKLIKIDEKHYVNSTIVECLERDKSDVTLVTNTGAKYVKSFKKEDNAKQWVEEYQLDKDKLM